MTEKQILTEALKILKDEAKDLYLTRTIPELLNLPSALEFSKNYVGKNFPVVIRNCILDWPAVIKWNSKYFREKLNEKLVTVAITPNGYADGIAKHNGKEYFVLPEEKEVKMEEFLNRLDKRSGPVYYIQKQNSNLNEEFPELLEDIKLDSLNFAKEVFNNEPDASNFWMGDERAVTSMHKDPYENIYCVISGFKDFILIPPIDYHNIPRKKYPIGIYKSDENDKMHIEPIVESEKLSTTEWVSIDPLNPDTQKYPSYENASVYEVQVNAGDILYLPSLWYHHVRQSHKCIAVNFWYDMEYDSRYCYYKMIEHLCSNQNKNS